MAKQVMEPSELGRSRLERKGSGAMDAMPRRVQQALSGQPLQYGFLHGGVLSYLADNALTFAGGRRLEGQVVSGEYKISYIRPARGDALVARAEVISSGKTQSVPRCEIYALTDGTERLCAAAQGTITVTRGINAAGAS